VKTECFTISQQLPASDLFAHSSYLPASVHLGVSSPFTKSSIFEKSDYFTLSPHLRISHLFSDSGVFLRSSSLSGSVRLDVSFVFGDSELLDPSKRFSDSITALLTSIFSHSSGFAGSSKIDDSTRFCPSGDGFTPTHALSSSQGFSLSPIFPPSILFYFSSTFHTSPTNRPSHIFTHSLHFGEDSPLSPSSPSFIASLDFTESLPANGVRVGQRAPTTNLATILGSSIAALILVAIFLLVLLFLRRRKPIDETVEELTVTTDVLSSDSTEFSGNGQFMSEYGFSGSRGNSSDGDNEFETEDERNDLEDEEGFVVSDGELAQADDNENDNNHEVQVTSGNEQLGPDADEGSMSISDEGNSLRGSDGE
jgi:hypothetical protein